MRYWNRSIGSDELHSRRFGEVNEGAGLDDKVFGDADAWAIVILEETGGDLEREKS